MGADNMEYDWKQQFEKAQHVLGYLEQ